MKLFLLTVSAMLLLACAQLADAQQAPVRVNCGGPAYMDTNLIVWAADFGFDSGQPFNSPQPVKGTPDQPLFLTERYATKPALIYTFTALAPGNYHINLSFAENYFNAAGKRVFDVKAQGIVALKAFDIFAAVGASTAIIKSFDVVVDASGKLILEFDSVVNNAKIDAIEILPAGPAPPPPPLQIVTPLGTFTFPTVVNGSMQAPVCTPADGVCTQTLIHCQPDGVTCAPAFGTVLFVKTVTLPTPQTLTVPLIVASP